MRFEEDDRHDYFDGEDLPDEPKEVKEVKKPRIRPEDPRYWDEPEPAFGHLRPGRSRRLWLWVGAAGLVLGLIIAGYIRWFAPYAINAVQYGYVDAIEERGLLFKSYEGVLLPYKNLMDTTRVYEGDFVFSTLDTPSAVLLRKMQYANRPVRVEYRKYRSTVPWRGDTRYLVVAVDTVDPATILPPDRQPKF